MSDRVNFPPSPAEPPFCVVLALSKVRYSPPRYFFDTCSVVDIDEKNLAIMSLEGENDDRAGADVRGSEQGVDTRTGATRSRDTAHRGRHHHGKQLSPRDLGSRVEPGRGGGEDEEQTPESYAERRTVSRTLSSWKEGLRMLLTRFAGLRSELQRVNAQARKTPRLHTRKYCSSSVAVVGPS